MIYQYAINIEKINDLNQLEVLKDQLSRERISKIDKYYFTKDKIRSLLAEALVRFSLCNQYDLKNIEIQFHYSKYGKPSLISEKNIHFNLSHAGEWVVCAIGDTPVGVDVEVIRDSQMPSAHQCFSDHEIQVLYHIPEENQAELFYKIWTLKESFVKYNGKGLNDPFEKFSINIHDNEIELMEDEKINLDVSFLSNKIDCKHWYALCTERFEIVNNMEIVTLKELLLFFFHSLEI